MSWLDRQGFLGKESEDVLGSLTVGIVGLGGGGSHIAQQLAHVGIGHFVVIDDDIIADTNLNRLVGGTLEDVRASASKVDIAERVIRGINPGTIVEKHKKRWQEASEFLKSCDVVIAGVDNVRSKHELDAFTKRFMIPFIDMGMDVTFIREGEYLISGQVVLTGPGEPCLQCLGIVSEEALSQEAAIYGAAGARPQVVWPNGVLASIAVGLFIQLVTPWKKQCLTSAFVEYDGNFHVARESRRLHWCRQQPCSHYLSSGVGDPFFDVRKLAARGEHSGIACGSESTSLLNKWWNSLRRRLSSI